MKTEQERIDYIASRIRNFKIVVGGEGHVEGGFGRIPSDGVTIDHLEASFNKFRLQAAFTKPEIPSEGFPYPVPPPTPTTGACCVSSDCSIETEDDCAGMGGTYMGDDTTCDEGACAYGACCQGPEDGSRCDIKYPAFCDGTYLGDGTNCDDPNPCCRYFDVTIEVSGSSSVSSPPCPDGMSEGVSASETYVFSNLQMCLNFIDEGDSTDITSSVSCGSGTPNGTIGGIFLWTATDGGYLELTADLIANCTRDGIETCGCGRHIDYLLGPGITDPVGVWTRTEGGGEEDCSSLTITVTVTEL